MLRAGEAQQRLLAAEHFQTRYASVTSGFEKIVPVNRPRIAIQSVIRKMIVFANV